MQALEISVEGLSEAKKQNLNDVQTRPSSAELQKRHPNWTPNACAVKSLAACLASAEAVDSITTVWYFSTFKLKNG
jgi:hypothetical protein